MLGKGEDFRALLGNCEGVLKLRTATAISSEHGPAVVPHIPIAGAEGDHRLDRERHAGLDHRVVGGLVVVRNHQARVERGMHAVTGVVTNHAIAEALGVALDHSADHVDLAPGLDSAGRAYQRLVGALGEQPAGFIDVAAKEGHTGVPMDAAYIGSHIDLDDVTLLERASVWDAVADHLIDRCTAGFREPAIAER